MSAMQRKTRTRDRTGRPDLPDRYAPPRRGLSAVEDARRSPPKQPNLIQEPRRVTGFVCASDPNAIAGIFPAPVSYRATTGDVPDGRNGAFAPCRRISIAQVEASDGSSYTAG